MKKNILVLGAGAWGTALALQLAYNGHNVKINSTLMCPSKVPVMTILEPENVAISIKKLLDL